MNAAFDQWWANEGSAMRPGPNEDHKEHTKRIAAIAWSNGAYKATEPTDAVVNKAARVLADRYAEACEIDKHDNWKVYSEGFIEDTRAMLESIWVKP